MGFIFLRPPRRGLPSLLTFDDVPFKDKILNASANANSDVLDFFFRDMKRRALATNVPEISKRVVFKDISSAIRQHAVPILLVNAKFLHGENTPHWIVVRGWSSQGAWINDPL